MAFIFTCGTHTFSSLLKGYENVTAQCQNCGNFSARVYKRWEWFTFCFIPGTSAMRMAQHEQTNTAQETNKSFFSHTFQPEARQGRRLPHL
jgi:hypothetical protein